MSKSINCNLYFADNSVGENPLIRKIKLEGSTQTYIPLRRASYNKLLDYLYIDTIKYNQYLIEVKVEEISLFSERFSGKHKIISDNSVVILTLSLFNFRGKDSIESELIENLNKIPINCIVLIIINLTEKNVNYSIDFFSIKNKYPFIREIIKYNIEKETFEDFNYLLTNLIINQYTDRLNYAREKIKDNLLKKDPELNLGNCSLTSLYEVEELFENTHIEILILSNEWAEFKNNSWQKITNNNKLEKNTLGVFPSKIKNLKNLKHLVAGGDWNNDRIWWNRWRIDDLSSILNLTELEYLNISNNKIKVIPSLLKLKKLRILHLNNNEISKVNIRSNSKTLEEIFLSNNQLETTSFAKHFIVAKTIDLHANKIKSLAPIISQINRMNITESKWQKNTINIAKNPLGQPPMEIINISKEAVINYFDDISKGGSYINKDIKLILVGNSEVGKTTLAKYLNNEIEFEKEHSATHWLEEKQLKSKHIIEKIKEKCNINLFDFGGHDYFHDTHHLFFSKNTIYLLLWDKETNNLNFRTTNQKNNKNKIEEIKTQDYPIKYWLDSIKYFIKEKETQNFEFEIEKEDEYNSFTLLIQNKVSNSEEMVHINNSEMFLNYPFIFEFINISLKPKRNLFYLDSLITEMINDTKTIGAKLPSYYRVIKNNIRIYKGKSILSIKEFNTFCNNLLTTKINLEQTKYLAGYLKQIGVILYYPTANNRDKVYINKKWVIDKIYQILQGLNEKNGEFDREHINNTLQKVGGVAEIESIIQLMIEFKIIFIHPESKNYIAPLYLPLQPIKAVELFIDTKKIPYRRFLYNGFIQKNVVLSFFQEYGKLVIKENGSTGSGLYYYWKDGLVIKDLISNEIVMVKFNIGDTNGNAFIDIVQINKIIETQFIQEIVNYLKSINKDYDIEEMVTLDGIDYVSLEILNKNANEGRLIFTERRSLTDEVFKESINKELHLKDYKMFLENPIKKKKVVISYSKKDLTRVHTLIRYLKPLIDLDLIERPWYCTNANPGDEWDSKIQSKFIEADIIFFMVSEYFYSTEYIVEKEIKVAIDKYDKDKSVKIIPIILEHYDWGRKEPYNLQRFSALPYQAKPISDFNNEKLSWHTITLCVRAMIEKDLDPAKTDILSRELQEIYERQVDGKLDFNTK